MRMCKVFREWVWRAVDLCLARPGVHWAGLEGGKLKWVRWVQAKVLVSSEYKSKENTCMYLGIASENGFSLLWQKKGCLNLWG